MYTNSNFFYKKGQFSIQNLEPKLEDPTMVRQGRLAPGW
jgi:hypothetical protein